MSLSRAVVLQKAWPIILANAAVPTLGLVDTAVVGNLGTTAELGAIALGAVIFSFVYWSFGFLRMGTTGFTAQAAGAGDETEVRASLARALIVAVAAGLLLFLARGLIASIALLLLDGSSEVEAITRDYVLVRIWGAPATLATFALVGTLVGLGYSRTLLAVQLFLNGLNMGLDVYFAGTLAMGARGIALGTALAEWTTFFLALAVVYRQLASRGGTRLPLWPWEAVVNAAKFRHSLAANRDILVRTLCLVFAFAWFANQGARFGNTLLAANHILLQLIAFSAFFLDGYAFVLEAMVGKAAGARDGRYFQSALRFSSELALATALLLAALIVVGGDILVAALTDISEVRAAAIALLPMCAVYVALSFAAFQLDGLFIGLTRTSEMRKAALFSLAVFLPASWFMTGLWGNAGLWWAFVIYVLARAATLMVYLPRVQKSIAPESEPSAG